MSGAFCVAGAASGANQPNCGDNLAIASLAVSPYDCQATVAATPMPNAIRKRTMARKAVAGGLLGNRSTLRSAGRSVVASTDGWMGNWSLENSDCVGLGMEFIAVSVPFLRRLF